MRELTVPIGIVLLTAAACGRYDYDAAIPRPDPFRKPIHIRPPAGLSGDLFDFPVAIALVSDPDLAAHADPSGDGFHFTEPDGRTALAAEVERYDPGTLAAWVRVPRLVVGQETLIYLAYGGAGPPGGPTDPEVWPGAAAVWHLTGDASGPGGDSGPDGHELRAVTPATLPTSVPGLVGLAADYDGVDDALVGDDPPDGSLDFGTSTFSYSSWVHVEASVGLYDTPWHKGGSSSDTVGYDFELGTDDWRALISDGVTLVTVPFGNEATFLGRWVHLVAVVDREALQFRLYADGSLRAEMSLAGFGSVSTTWPATIGRDDASWFRGAIDEVRVWRGAVSADWVRMEHANLADPTAVVEVGAEEAVSP